jgi:hypothetical protein
MDVERGMDVLTLLAVCASKTCNSVRFIFTSKFILLPGEKLVLTVKNRKIAVATKILGFRCPRKILKCYNLLKSFQRLLPIRASVV